MRRILLGESILPYRLFQKFEGVVPISDGGDVIDAEGAESRGYEGLAGWMQQAEAAWIANRPSELSFTEQLDYYGKLTSQFPLAPLRVAYAKAGSQPAALVLRDCPAVLDHKLYWSAPASEDEALYLAAILNSETARLRTERLQSRGQFGARDFDKVIWSLPIPRFDKKRKLHLDLAAAAHEAETVAAEVELPETVKFQRARKLVREALTDADISPRINALVVKLLDG